jgi:hypothetical protein
MKRKEGTRGRGRWVPIRRGTSKENKKKVNNQHAPQNQVIIFSIHNTV